MPNKYADLGFEPIKEDIPVSKKKADYSDLGFEPMDQGEADYSDLGFEPEIKTSVPSEIEDREFKKMSRLGKVIDVISRPSAAIKSSILEIQKQTPKFGIKTDEQGKISFGEIEPAEKQFSVPERIKALGRGFTGKERISANELYKNVGVEGVPLLGFATEVAIDPLSYAAAPLIKGALKGISGVAKATKTGEMLSKIIPSPVKTAGTQIAGKIAETTAPLRKQFKRAFSTSTGIKPLDDLINKYSGQREYMKSQAFQYGVKTRNVIQNLSKKTGRSIDDISQEVVNLIEQPEIVKATIPETQLLAKTLGNKFSDILTKEMKAGVPITALSANAKGIQYFPRITTSEAKQYLKQAKIGNSRVWNPKIANALKRKTGDFTLEEFNTFAAEYGLEILGGKQVEQFFMKNPAYATAIRGIGSAKAVSSAGFIQEAGKIFGKTIKEIPYGKELPESLTKIYPSLKGKVFDPEVLEEITHTYEKVFNPQQVGEFLKIFDNVQNYWKSWTLSPFPKYHFRNIAGNLWNNYLAGVVNPKVYAEAGVLQQYKKTGSEQFLKSVGLAKRQADELIQKAEELGVLGHGWYGSDIPQAIEKAIKKPSLNLLSTEGALIRGGRAVGTTFENNARLAHFIDKIRKGATTEEAALSVKKFLFDYADLTPFEKQTMKRLMPFYCVPEHSFALSNKGWKTVDELKIGDILLTYNTKNKEYEWQPIKELAIFEHEENLVEWTNKTHKLMFTPEHRWIIKTQNINAKRNYGKKEYIYKSEEKIIVGNKLNKNHSIVTSSEYKRKGYSLLSPDEARLLGWLLTDGYWRWKGNYCEAMIYQHPKKFLEEVKLIAGGAPRKPHPQSGVICVPVKREKIEAIKNILKRKKTTDDWIDIVSQLNRSSLEALYDAMYKGDGNVKGQKFFACQLNGVGRTFEVLATLLGYRIVKNTRGFYVSSRRTLKISSGIIENKYYVGRVWCPKTENGTWVMKQDKLITITGNTFTRKNIPLQVEQFIKQPQKYLPITKLLQNRDTKNLARLKYTQPQLYERLPFELRKDIDTVTYVPLEGLIPAADLSKIIRPQELLFELVSPYGKNPVELGINKSFYNEREIEKYDNETQEFLRMDVPVKWKHAITTILPQARLLNEINKIIKKKGKSLPLTASEQVFSQTLSSVYKMDVSDMQLKAFQKIKFKIDDLKNVYRWAIRNKRPSEAKRILKTINEVVGQFKNVL